MKRSLVFAALLAALLTALLGACGGSGGGSVADRTPSAAAPRNVIAFGAVDAAGANALYTVQPDGTQLNQLADELLSVSFPRWSPDGARIAYVVAGERGPGTEATLRIYDFNGQVASTVSDHVLAAGDDAPMAWSPNGKRIAFIEATGGGQLRVFDIDKGELLDDPSLPATAVDWSSRDQLAIVASDGQASPDIYTVKPNGKNRELRLAREGAEDGLAWSPDGKTLAFWSAPSPEISGRMVLLLPHDERSAQEVALGLDPRWSNDGQLAYSGPPAAGTRGVLDIYTTVAAGAQPARLTQSITLDRWPSWSPASDAVVYLAEADASTTFLCLIALATQDNTCLELEGLTPSAAAWSPY